MDTIETAVQVSAKLRELDFAKRQLLQDLDGALNEFGARKSEGDRRGMDYASGKYMGLLAGLLYSGSITGGEHNAHVDTLIRAIEGSDGHGHL